MTEDVNADWVLVDEKMLKEMYEKHLAKKAKRNKPKTFMGGYGMIVSTKKKKRA